MRSRNLILAIILIALILPLTSCETTKTVVIHEYPDVTFPTFPDPEPVVLDGENVTMPLWYFTKIAEYKADVDAIEEYLARLREAEGKKSSVK